MSIIFTKPINEDRLRLAYNNDVLRFRSDYTLAAKSCTISNRNDTTSLNIKLYPAPDGSFFFNFKPYITALINTRNFEDTLQPVLDRTNANSFVYDATPGTLLQLNVNIEITFSDESTDDVTHTLTWLAAAAQLGDYTPLSKSNAYVLTPFAKASANAWYLKYWQGYPFDASVYTPIKPFTVHNETNLLMQQFNPLGTITGNPIADAIIKGALTASTAVKTGKQIKEIQSAKKPKQPKFAQGGLVTIGGNRHSAGGTLFTGADGTRFEAEQGELIGVMNRNAAAHFMAFNNAFPAGGGSAPNYFAGGGIVSREIASPSLNIDELAAKIALANSTMPAPVVAVQDIVTQGNSYVQVREAANF